MVTGSCCLDHGLRRTGDWSEAGLTLSCCCSVICSVSPDRHWLVLIMATRGAGVDWSELEADTEHPDSGAGTHRYQTGGCRVNLHYSLEQASSLEQPRTASQHYSQFLCSHTQSEVAWWKLYVEPCLCLAKWQQTK